MGSSSSKSTFENCFQELRNPEVSLDNEELWEDLFGCGISKIQDVLETVSPEEVWQLKEERWDALKALMLRCAAKLCEFLEHQDSAETPLQNEMQVALRIFACLWPILLSGRSDMVNDFLWQKRPTHELMPFLDPTENEEYNTMTYSVASVVLQACLHLCFFPDFASDSFSLTYGDDFSPNPEHKYNISEASLCWASGIAITEDMLDDTSEFASNRIEVMQTLLSMTTGDIFLNPDEYTISGNKYLQLLTSDELPFAAELFYSLINVVMSYDPVGWAIPFGATFEGQTPALQVETCLQLLLALINHGEKYVGQPKYTMDGGVQPGFNTFRRHVGHLCTAEEFNVILDGTLRLLKGQPVLQTTYMPGAITQLRCSTELVLFFYHVLVEADDFCSHILRYPAKTTQLVILLCYLIHHSLDTVNSSMDSEEEDYEDDIPIALGTIQICLLLLRTLSEQRQFALTMRMTYTPDPSIVLPLPAFTGNYGDLLLLTFQKVLFNSKGLLEPLYKHAMVILCNISPFLSSISKTSSMKLLGLVDLFSSLKFVLKRNERRDTLLSLLTFIENIIMYQYQGNKTLVYALMQRKQIFHKLLSIKPEILDFKSLLEVEKKKENKMAQELEDRISRLDENADSNRVGTKSDDESWEQVESGANSPKVGTPASRSRATTFDLAQKKLNMEKKLNDEAEAKEFVNKIQESAALKHISALLQHLEPQAANIGDGEFMQEQDILTFLEDTSMIGVLPPPPEFSPTVGLQGDETNINLWIRIFTWDVIIRGSAASLVLEHDSLRQAIKLFTNNWLPEEGLVISIP